MIATISLPDIETSNKRVANLARAMKQHGGVKARLVLLASPSCAAVAALAKATLSPFFSAVDVWVSKLDCGDTGLFVRSMTNHWFGLNPPEPVLFLEDWIPAAPNWDTATFFNHRAGDKWWAGVSDPELDGKRPVGAFIAPSNAVAVCPILRNTRLEDDWKERSCWEVNRSWREDPEFHLLFEPPPVTRRVKPKDQPEPVAATPTPGDWNANE